jgi:NADPH2:quinone reductase
VLVLGAAGGVGLAAVQLGALAGARVIAAASSDAKLAACRAEGAHATVNYTRQSLKGALKELSGGKGVDVVVDPVGGALSEQALRATGWGGRFVVVGFASGEIPRVPLNLPLLKGSQICAFNIAPFLFHEPDQLRRNQEALLAMLAEGKIRPRISSRYALNDAAAALREVGERRAIGKVVVEME